MPNLTVTLTESITLNGALRGSTNSLSIADIIDTFERVVTCPHTNTTTIATFSNNVFDSAGDIDAQGVKYARVTNLSDTEDLTLAVVGASTLYQVLIPAAQSHIICRADDGMLSEADTSPSFATLEDLTSLQVRPSASSDVQVEVFIATA